MALNLVALSATEERAHILPFGVDGLKEMSPCP